MALCTLCTVDWLDAEAAALEEDDDAVLLRPLAVVVAAWRAVQGVCTKLLDRRLVEEHQSQRVAVVNLLL